MHAAICLRVELCQLFHIQPLLQWYCRWPHHWRQIGEKKQLLRFSYETATFAPCFHHHSSDVTDPCITISSKQLYNPHIFQIP